MSTPADELVQRAAALGAAPPRVLLATAGELLAIAARRGTPRARRVQLALLAADLAELAARKVRTLAQRHGDAG